MKQIGIVQKGLVVIIIGILVFGTFGKTIAATIERLGGYTDILSNTTFNNVTTATNTSGYPTLMNIKTAFFVKYVETGTVANMSLTIKPQVSQDDVTYVDMFFYDVAGTATAQTSEVISVNGTYYFWMPDVIAPYTRINMVAANATATNVTSVQSYIIGSINPGNR